jgi:hypothetical protein
MYFSIMLPISLQYLTKALYIKSKENVVQYNCLEF